MSEVIKISVKDKMNTVRKITTLLKMSIIVKIRQPDWDLRLGFKGYKSLVYYHVSVRIRLSSSSVLWIFNMNIFINRLIKSRSIPPTKLTFRAGIYDKLVISIRSSFTRRFFILLDGRVDIFYFKWWRIDLWEISEEIQHSCNDLFFLYSSSGTVAFNI